MGMTIDLQLLSGHLQPYAQALGPDFIFMDDNAPCHRVHKVRIWMMQQQITFMEVWPPQSPDLNPIKHVWDLLGRLMDDKKPRIRVQAGRGMEDIGN